MFIFQEKDDRLDSQIGEEELSLKDQMTTLSFDALSILLENLITETTRTAQAVDDLTAFSIDTVSKSLRPARIMQSVKAVCALLGHIETLDVEEVLDTLNRDISDMDKRGGRSDEGVDRDRQKAKVKASIDRVRDVVQKLVEVYAKTFRVNFAFSQDDGAEAQGGETGIFCIS